MLGVAKVPHDGVQQFGRWASRIRRRVCSAPRWESGLYNSRRPFLAAQEAGLYNNIDDICFVTQVSVCSC